MVGDRLALPISSNGKHRDRCRRPKTIQLAHGRVGYGGEGVGPNEADPYRTRWPRGTVPRRRRKLAVPVNGH